MWGLIVKALKDALKVEAQKALLDAETRRKTRLFWGPVGLLIGAVVGYVCAAFF